MNYSIKKDLHSNVSIFSVNKLVPRAYFVPFADKDKLDATSYLDERYNSDKVQLLNGEWGFKYYEDCRKMPTSFISGKLEFDDITVPSTWQRTGYAIPWYLNSRYQFPIKPPIIPANMPVGIYHKTFVVGSNNGKFILTFLGVSNSLAVYMNGDFVGYSEGSHNMAEFDISKYLVTGTNEIICVVHKWCNGSYLECQDMFRENGIFRDVYITECENTDIVDFEFVTTRISEREYSLSVDISVDNPTRGSKVSVEILDMKGKLIASNECKANKLTSIFFESLKVKEWSAEIPNLYKVYLSVSRPSKDSTIIRQYIGFKKVEIKGEVFLINNQDVKLKGVNHHDTDAKNGWVMTTEQLYNDVKIMKEYNCNTVRMSHYPPDPIMIAMCDHVGLYVVDEADIECHGIYSNPVNAKFGLISNNMIWKEQFIDRVSNMYFRDRNHSSIIMWSLGNESGGYKCHDAAYDYLKALTKIPVHYEGVIHTKRHSYDMVSEMYTTTAKVKNIGDHTIDSKWLGKPFFICEYAHAMGVGPGAIDKYMQLFLKYDNLMGGCIWEFCDHAVYNEASKYKLTYGGDHGETKHDGNFCVDGLFFYDRTPSSGALNMKNVYRPIRGELMDNCAIRFLNTNRFLNTKDITAEIVYFVNGVESARHSLVMNIAPKHHIDYDVEGNFDKTKDNYIVIFYKRGDIEIAKEQHNLTEANYCINRIKDSKLAVESTNNIHTVRFQDGNLIFDGNTGEIVSYSIDNIELINSSPKLGKRGFLPNMYRGLIDNDRFIQILWKALGYHKNAPRFCKASVIIAENSVSIRTHYIFKHIGTVAKITIEYDINCLGDINVKLKASKGLKLSFYSDIVRLGLTLEMPKEFCNIEYYGKGDTENFSDFHEHTHLGIFNTQVKNMRDIYIKPQESGNRTEVRYAKVTNEQGAGLLFVHGDGKYLNFNASHYTFNEIKCAKHIEDLPDGETTNVQIDGFMRGVGSQSCGQGPLEGHKPSLKKGLEYSFTVIPIKKKV